jgi:NADPH:quinone reductase-like Zn-dependent oxidoreductase
MNPSVTMKAIHLQRFGIANLTLVDIPRPEPGSYEVLVRITAAAIQYLDTIVIEGTIIPDLPLPHIPGCEGAGVVESVGQRVTRWKKGDRVIIPFIRRWAAGQITPWQNEIRTGVQTPGALCEYSVQPENTLVRTPENLTDEEAATLPVIGLSAWSSLVSQAGIRPGQVILVQGSGAISLFALQIARVFGLTIIATTGNSETESKLRSLGAQEVINYREKKDWSKEVKRLNRGVGVDVTLDIGGTQTIQQSILSCRENAYVGLVGFLTGSEITIDVHYLIMNNIRLQGYTVGHAQDLEALVAAIAANNLRPVIDSIFPLEKVQDAFELLISGRAFGRVVIKI